MQEDREGAAWPRQLAPAAVLGLHDRTLLRATSGSPSRARTRCWTRSRNAPRRRSSWASCRSSSRSPSPLPIGIISAIRQDSWIDYFLRFFSIFFLGIPVFVVAIITIVLTSRYADGTFLPDWFGPQGSYASLTSDPVQNMKIDAGAGADRRPGHGRCDHALPPLADAGGAAPGLRAHGLVQGPEGARRSSSATP